jgi:hypothetical protein
MSTLAKIGSFGFVMVWFGAISINKDGHGSLEWHYNEPGLWSGGFVLIFLSIMST